MSAKTKGSTVPQQTPLRRCGAGWRRLSPVNPPPPPHPDIFSVQTSLLHYCGDVRHSSYVRGREVDEVMAPEARIYLSVSLRPAEAATLLLDRNYSETT